MAISIGKDIKFAYKSIEEDIILQFNALPNYKDYEPYMTVRGSVKRKKELAAAVVLLNEVLDRGIRIAYTPEGKPYLTDSATEISISHTKDYVAVATAEKCNVGIDIEKIQPRILQLAQRYMTEKEYNKFSTLADNLEDNPSIAEQYATMVWCAKEAVFKIVGNQVADFLKQEISIELDNTHATVLETNQTIQLHIVQDLTDHIIVVAHD